ncbi:TPA: hypothetical protein JDY45_22925 [Citrobacter freundii]|nr:hypothetical protein F3113_21855 [Citrobacter freundii]HAU4420604.1 hypothetical protein [Citrobacter freundii]HAU4428450.1 hypothetical protein [Citrobacter freundii]HAU4434032.1 hypothetical protein [Citrobacter freundii]HAU4441265.1 hypothetical protein [Citrobacter freundii]
MTTQTVTQISAAARGKWPVILQMLRIDVPENGRHGPCPKCGGKDRFRLDDLDGRGTWICRNNFLCEKHGNPRGKE